MSVKRKSKREREERERRWMAGMELVAEVVDEMKVELDEEEEEQNRQEEEKKQQDR